MVEAGQLSGDEDWSPSQLLSDAEEGGPDHLPEDEGPEDEEPEHLPKKDHLTCGICLQLHGDDPVEALECGHVFHSECLSDWYRTATPAPQVGDCPNRCDRLFRQMQGQQQVLASDMSEQAQEAEMLELFG